MSCSGNSLKVNYQLITINLTDGHKKAKSLINPLKVNSSPINYYFFSRKRYRYNRNRKYNRH